MSLLKYVVGGFFYIVPDEQLLKNYKPLFKKYSLLQTIKISLLLCFIVTVTFLILLLPGIIKNFRILHFDFFKLLSFVKFDFKILFYSIFIAPILENFIIMKILVSVKYNINKMIVILAFLAVLIHYLDGHGLPSLWSGFMFYIFMDVFLGGFKQGKNGFLLSVFCHSFYNLLLTVFVEILQIVTNVSLIPHW